MLHSQPLQSKAPEVICVYLQCECVLFCYFVLKSNCRHLTWMPMCAIPRKHVTRNFIEKISNFICIFSFPWDLSYIFICQKLTLKTAPYKSSNSSSIFNFVVGLFNWVQFPMFCCSIVCSICTFRLQIGSNRAFRVKVYMH